MFWEVTMVGMGKEVELTPVGDTWRWEASQFVKVEEASRKIITVQPKGTLQLNFYNTSGPENLPEEQNIYYGKYAIKDLASGKIVYVDFRDADYPYTSGTMNIVADWKSLEDDKVCEIWNWNGNAKLPNHTPFGL